MFLRIYVFGFYSVLPLLLASQFFLLQSFLFYFLGGGRERDGRQVFLAKFSILNVPLQRTFHVTLPSLPPLSAAPAPTLPLRYMFSFPPSFPFLYLLLIHPSLLLTHTLPTPPHCSFLTYYSPLLFFFFLFPLSPFLFSPLPINSLPPSPLPYLFHIVAFHYFT